MEDGGEGVAEAVDFGIELGDAGFEAFAFDGPGHLGLKVRELEGLTFGFGWWMLASLVGDCVWAPELGADGVDGFSGRGALFVGVAEAVVHGDSLLRRRSGEQRSSRRRRGVGDTARRG